MLVSSRQLQEHLTSLLQGSSSSTSPCHHTSDMSNKINLKPRCNVLGAGRSAKSPYDCGRKPQAICGLHIRDITAAAEMCREGEKKKKSQDLTTQFPLKHLTACNKQSACFCLNNQKQDCE